MAQIVINEISQSFTYNIGTNNYATVAMPITACWGPAYLDPATAGVTRDEMLENSMFTHYPATQRGLEAFVSTYRGPASNYRLAKDYSYQIVMTLLTAGYDVLVCRLSPGTGAQGSYVEGTWSTDDPPVFTPTEGGGQLIIRAKYVGTFGNTLRTRLVKVADRRFPDDPTKGYWALTTYSIDASGIQTSLETLMFVMDTNNSTDSMLHISELESNYLTFTVVGNLTEATDLASQSTTVPGEYGFIATLAGASDKAAEGTVADMMTSAIAEATTRYQAARQTTDPITDSDYLDALATRTDANTDLTTASNIRYMEWLYTAAYFVYDLLKDKLSYAPQRIISPGWDDQDITAIDGSPPARIKELSPLHIKLMDVGYYSRCGASLLDIPRAASRGTVSTTDPSTPNNQLGYAQMLARYTPLNALYDINSVLYQTHSALIVGWGQYVYVGTSKQAQASPSFQTLMIDRAMKLNQANQYEWLLPSNRTHNIRLGKLAYKVPKKLLDDWQDIEGVGVNVVCEVNGLGIVLWGNSTLFEVPPATYQALANLSTRYLANAIENVAYRCSLSITFQYNNEQAYSQFYAGCTPILDSMVNAGALIAWRIEMSADINATDMVHANTVIGKIWIQPYGVVNDVIIDLIVLPPHVDIDTFATSTDQI